MDLLRAELDEVAHLAGQDAGAPYALFGSIVMLFSGSLGRPLGDVDVFVAPQVWEQLAARIAWELHLPDPADPPFLSRRIDGLNVHAFYRWTDKDPEVNALECRLRAELVHGWWCTPLELVRRHKALCGKHDGSARHVKHARDVAVIDADLFEFDVPSSEVDRTYGELEERLSRLGCPLHSRTQAVLSVCRCGRLLVAADRAAA